MKQLSRLLLAVAFGLALFSASGSADPSKGEKILNKLIMRAGGCQITSARIAMAHSLKEWAKLYKEGKMEAEIQKLCPKMGKLPPIPNKKYAQDVYEYLEHYSNDSGAIPA
ncbi:hypothetical protein [Nitratifractor sp.]